MKIFWPDHHFTVVDGLAKTLQILGHQMIMPSKDYEISLRPRHTDFVWNEGWDDEKVKERIGLDNVIVGSKERILDEKPDILFVSCFENQFEVIEHLWGPLKHSGTKLAFFSANDYWDTAYPWRNVDERGIPIVQNYVAADRLAVALCNSHGTPNWIDYRPWIDYDKFKYEGTNDSNRVGSYINEYQSNFPQAYSIYDYITKEEGFKDFDFFQCDDKSRDEVVSEMNNSFCSLHLKNLEGYGYSIIESMAMGRPVFLYRAFAGDKSYRDWAIEGETCFFFGNPVDPNFTDEGYDELMFKLKKLHEDESFRHETQRKCSESIRQLVNNEEQTENFRLFLENIQ